MEVYTQHKLSIVFTNEIQSLKKKKLKAKVAFILYLTLSSNGPPQAQSETGCIVL